MLDDINDNVTLRKMEGVKTKKESNREIITWKDKDNDIFSIKKKASKSKTFKEIGEHYIIGNK